MTSFGKKLILVGAVTIAIAVLWFGTFSQKVSAFIGAPVPNECLYTLGGPCAVLKAGADIVMGNAYDARVFWAGFAALLIGCILHTASERPARIKVKPPRERVEPRF